MNIEAIIREKIKQPVHLSLGTSVNNKPWVCEVHFAYDDELNLYFRSTTARRHSQEIASNSHVAGNIVEQFGVGEPCGGAVYFEGTARLLEPGDELQKGLELLKDRLQLGDKILEQATTPEASRCYKITVANWYAFGDFDGAGNKKLELAWQQQ